MRREVSSQFHFDILDETEDYIVVNKPAPLQIHPSKPADAGLTLWDGLREVLAYELVNGGQISIINRLDRETSGLVLIAKNSAAARRFGKAMLRRQIQKSYRAIVFGWPDWESVTVDAPILRAGEVMECPIWVKQIVHEKGAACLSEFHVLEKVSRNGQPFSLVEAKPHTGRMHQLRVHLSHLGFPVVGDKLYGWDDYCYLEFIETSWTASLQSRLLLPRQALHSHRLEIDDAGESLAWEAPFTADLQTFLDQCEGANV